MASLLLPRRVTTPGPSFLELLRRADAAADGARPTAGDRLAITHGTTVVAVRYADGVVMAGDRRATSGNLISHRTMEKVYPADRHSGVAIAGAAGPAMDMVKLFQLQLEHYEKVEGVELTLEGKANQLAGDGPQPPAGRHAGPRRRAALRRLRHPPRAPAACSSTTSPAAATRSRNFATTGSGSLHAGTVDQARLPRGPRPRGARSTSPSRRCSTPPTRTPPPAAPTSSAASTRRWPPSPTSGFERVDEAEIADRFRQLVDRLSHAREHRLDRRRPDDGDGR